ncbi:unnamed protein product [Porites lobata]|uniref:Ion transport domain-containing protein n=1 Tax=Porites lobata TaxID=104759 RepID=A0ABN8QMA9_9CNID|nr:unnamed protein product [Porites lobata]
MMEDKFSGSGKDAFKDSLTWTREGNISLIQHAINVRCKSKFLLELWWFIVFLSLIIITSCEKNFNQRLPSGLTLPDIFVFFFVVTFSLRRLFSFWHYLQTLITIPRYRRNWRLILPELLTFVECASLVCFITAFSIWITRWDKLHRWQPSDKDYQSVDVFYSLASLLSFFKLAHYLKAHHTLGTLNLSLYMMITKDVIYFAIIFVMLLYIPFATALEKMYSYYVVDSVKNATHPLASYSRTYDDLLWAMLGSDERKESDVSDSGYAYIKKLGEAYIIMFVVAAVVVAFNMLVATMNHTYENIMRNVDKEYVFSRTKMWMDYIAKDHSSMPPPLNLADIVCFFKYLCTARNEASQEDRFKEKQKERISIIKRLVFRYLLRSLGLNNSEYSHDILIQSQSSASQSPLVV